MIRIEAENVLKMTETEMLDVVFEASENSVVRDRWPNQDNHRVLVRTKDIYSIYRALVDQVEEVA